jgi:hypothetical protein
MTTAAVGLRPKIVVRSLMAARGRAEPSSVDDRPRSLRVAGRSGAAVAGRSVAAGAPGLVDDELLLESPEPEVELLLDVPGVDTVPLADPDGVDTEPLADDPDGLLLPVCASAATTRPAVASAMRRMAMVFMLNLLTVHGSNGSATGT